MPLGHRTSRVFKARISLLRYQPIWVILIPFPTIAAARPVGRAAMNSLTEGIP